MCSLSANTLHTYLVKDPCGLGLVRERGALCPAQLAGISFHRRRRENKGQALWARTPQAPVLGELHSKAHHMVSVA